MSIITERVKFNIIFSVVLKFNSLSLIELVY